MDALDALASIDAELQALSHPLGSLAYQKTTRVAPAGRDVLAYADADAPAPPLMDDEYNEAKQRSDEEARHFGAGRAACSSCGSTGGCRRPLGRSIRPCFVQHWL